MATPTPSWVRTPAQLLQAKIAGQVSPGQAFDALPNFKELRSLGIEDMPHVWMPPDGLVLNKQYTIAAPAQNTTGTVIGQFNTKPNWWAVIKWIALCQSAAGFPEGSGAMTWRVLSSGNPVADFGNITIQIGNLDGAIIAQPIGPIVIRPNSTVSFQVDNLSWNPANVNCFAIARGWEWPHRKRD